MSAKTLILISPALILVELSQWVHAITNGWLFLKIKSYFEIILLLPKILAKRKKLKSLRKISDQEITRVYQGKLTVSGIKIPLLRYVLSPILNVYWKFIRNFI